MGRKDRSGPQGPNGDQTADREAALNDVVPWLASNPTRHW